MKSLITRWFESRTAKPTGDKQGLLPDDRSMASTDELEQRLISEADAWAAQYKQAKPSQIREVQPNTEEEEFTPRFRMQSRNRKMIQVVTLLAVGFIILCGVRTWYISSVPQSTALQEHRQEGLRLKDVEIQSLIATAHAVNEICDKIMAGVRRSKRSRRAWRVDINVEASLVNAAEHLKQPGRQYGRSLAWIDHRLQRLNPVSKDSTNDTSNYEQ